ncbi:hypothetical protein [Flavobacterium sp. PL02]|uniref:hypothetical protein n=1 Tax=Flavobacterium sp. PL02 TaxID=3088354 RepID=UPI002B237351|nr:hypothetical protein [Flavobacterium sp. PL02]MEA9411904.1 hypothetical protein [Flavobacterium sp. PL02]
MEEKVNKILELLKENDENSKKEILLECATKIGSTEWIEAVKDLWKRMESLNK